MNGIDRPTPRSAAQQHGRQHDLAWAPDLDKSIAGREQFDAKGLVIAHGSLKTFLESDGQDGSSSAFLVSGPRGMGKSLALAYKVARLHSGDRYTVIPGSFPFKYKLGEKRISLTAQQLFALNSHHTWAGIWLVSLGCFLAAWIKRENRQELTEGPFEWAAGLVAEANRWTGTRDEPFSVIVRVAAGLAAKPLKSFYEDHLVPIFLERRQQMAICVDAIDEGIAYLDSSGIGHSLFSIQQDVIVEALGQQLKKNFSALARDTWVAAQRGYAIAARDITTRTHHNILVLGSLRSEARVGLPESEDNVESKWSSDIEDLKVEKELFRAIFEANIDRSDNSRMVKPQCEDPIERFTGVKAIPSRVVAGQNESLLDYVLRHTFRTPRGIVQLGGAIYQKLYEGISRNPGSGEQQVARVVSAVNGCAASLVLDEHLSQQLPRLDLTAYRHALACIEHNILSRAELDKLDASYAIDHPADTVKLSAHLHAVGLLGLPRETDGEWRQTFLSGGEPSPGAAVLANANFAVVHPAFSAAICQQGRAAHTYYRSRFLVGHNLRCPSVFYPPAITVQALDLGNRKQLVASFEGADGRLLDLKLARNKVTYCFLFSLLLAISQSDEGAVETDAIVAAADTLSAAGFLTDTYGRSPLPPGEYLFHRLDEKVDRTTAKGSEPSIRDLTDMFKGDLGGLWRIKIDEHDIDLEFTLQYKLSSRSVTVGSASSFGDVSSEDIDFRVVVARPT